MKKALSLILCSYLASADYVLPTIAYDQTQATCDNAQTLMGVSTADLARLKYVSDVLLPMRVHRLTVSKRAAEKLCDFDSGSSTMLFQKSKMKQDGSLNDLCSNLEDAIGTLSQQLQSATISLNHHERSLHSRLDRLDDVLWTVTETCNLVSENLVDQAPSLVQLNKKRKLVTSDGDLDQACQDVTSGIDQLADYLRFVKSSIQSDYTEGVLPSRIQALTQQSTSCLQVSATPATPEVVRIANPNAWSFDGISNKITTLGDYKYTLSLKKDTLVEFIANGHASCGGTELHARFFVDETPIGTAPASWIHPNSVHTMGEYYISGVNGWLPFNLFTMQVVPKGDHVISFRSSSDGNTGGIHGLEVILKINH